eukprot:GFUD01014410.1.p1 GENE.GFUD01014410.1~~GFUD01014410.1.p1  ORF type:complete len:382 (+),score=152.38 GFUD01014410.1:163-1308(+)
MVGETAVETPVVDTKIDEPVKTDKEIIADEENVVQPENDEVESEKKDEEKTEETKKVLAPKKPTIHTKVWEEDKVYLYQSSRTPQIPSISPQELKLESWLKLHGIPYENVDHKAKLSSKKGSLPFIELNGEEVTDTATLHTLADKFGKDMSAHLSQEQKNVEHAMMKMVEYHIYWAIMHWRTSHVDNTLKAYKIHLPTFLGSKAPMGLLNLHFKFNICKKVKKQLKSQGLDNIEQLGKNDLEVLSAMLGEKEFMFGDQPAMLDLVVYSHLAQLIMVEAEHTCPLRDFLQESCKNLVELVNKMKDRCWADHWELATGEKMEHNPHIPKPEPVVEDKEENKEEVKEGEKDEKVEEKEPESAKEENVAEVKEESSEKKDAEKGV